MTRTVKPGMPQFGFADSSGLAIHFEKFGSGTPIILVHGWGADIQSNWVDSGWVSMLAEQRTVVALDVRGHGTSDKPLALDPYGYAAMSQDVLAVMDELDIDRADYLGYSMGSFMGAYLLGHHPQRFTSLVLGGIGDETAASAAQGSEIAEALRAADVSRIQSAVGRSVRRFVESIPHNDLESLAYSALKMWPEGYPLKIAGSNIAHARMPVLIVNGENDHPYVDSAEKLVKALPNGSYVKIPNTDHLTTVSNERFKQVVGEFLGF